MLSDSDRSLLGLVYRLMSQRGAWPTFTAVDLLVDRELGIEDPEAALIALPGGYLQRSRLAHGFRDTDEIRLTLKAVSECPGGPGDVAFVARFIEWVVDVERDGDIDVDAAIVVTSKEFADYVGIALDPPVNRRVEVSATTIADGAATDSTSAQSPAGANAVYRATQPEPPDLADARGKLMRLRVLVESLPHFWVSASRDAAEPWVWQYTLDRRRVRPYRRVRGQEALLDYLATEERVREAVAAAAMRGAVFTPGAAETPHKADVTGTLSGTVTSGHASSAADTELAVQMTMLRPEIADETADAVRNGRFDDAIFTAFRRVEHEVQQRVGNPSIGNSLFETAFRNTASPIRVSDRSQDKDRMVELFAGAIGLYKGDRSHKDRPLLPCRSRRECLRILAHASSLLDLLDRDIDRAPFIRGYEHHQGDTLTLSVERVGPQVDVWLDEATLLDIVSFRPGALVVSVAGVPIGEHRVHLVEGTRQGPAQSVWLTREPGRSSWYRIVEVNVPLYGDAEGRTQLDFSGVRLSMQEGGRVDERIVATQENYQVGHYVDWHWSTTAPAGPAWVRERAGVPLTQIWNWSSFFDGQPVAPAHAERLMNISIEPEYLPLRGGDKVPVRVLGHFTDGTATWTNPMDDPDVISSDEKVGFFQGGVVFAKSPGVATLRCLHSDHYSEATVEVASHPRGTVTSLITGLPPVSGVAWTPKGVVVSARSRDLWRVNTSGVYQHISATPWQWPDYQGTDNIFAREGDGELAVRIIGNRKILILHCADDYRSSHWVDPSGDGTPMAVAWDGDELIVSMNNGSIFRVGMDGTATLITTLPDHPVDVAYTPDSVLVLSRVNPNGEAHLWKIPFADPAHPSDLLATRKIQDVGGVVAFGSDVVLSQFHAGNVLLLRNAQLSMLASGLTNPTQMTVSDQGDLYIAEFGAGAVRRILP